MANGRLTSKRRNIGAIVTWLGEQLPTPQWSYPSAETASVKISTNCRASSSVLYR